MVQKFILDGAVKSGLFAKALEKLTKAALKAAGSVKKHGKAAVDSAKGSLRNPNGMKLLGASMVAEQLTGGQNALGSAASSAVSWGMAGSMFTPAVGALAAVAGGVYGYVTAAEEQVSETEKAKTVLDNLNQAQGLASEGFQGITELSLIHI